MDIIISEIKLTDKEKVKEFDNIKTQITYFLNNRYLDLNEKLKINEKVDIDVKLNTNTEIKIDLVKIAYIKLFKQPTNGIYDINKLKIIKKHLKLNNLI
tara:strand:+ start:1260 stop:1556 length:297 start_codon:yes stop_codon:yes gene_type:complete